jgi:hypothetical protein
MIWTPAKNSGIIYLLLGGIPEMTELFQIFHSAVSLHS